MRCAAIGSWLVLAAVLAPESAGMVLGPRARLRVITRGSFPFRKVEAQIAEVAAALKTLTRGRVCDDEEGCLTVEISGSPGSRIARAACTCR